MFTSSAHDHVSAAMATNDPAQVEQLATNNNNNNNEQFATNSNEQLATSHPVQSSVWHQSTESARPTYGMEELRRLNRRGPSHTHVRSTPPASTLGLSTAATIETTFKKTLADANNYADQASGKALHDAKNYVDGSNKTIIQVVEQLKTECIQHDWDMRIQFNKLKDEVALAISRVEEVIIKNHELINKNNELVTTNYELNARIQKLEDINFLGSRQPSQDLPRWQTRQSQSRETGYGPFTQTLPVRQVQQTRQPQQSQQTEWPKWPDMPESPEVPRHPNSSWGRAPEPIGTTKSAVDDPTW